MSRPVETHAPQDSRIAKRLAGASFHDAWRTTSAATDLPALGLFIEAARRTPRWVDACMRLRNRVVRAFGLKDLGAMAYLPAGKPAADYRPGERVGIFTVFENEFDEALIGDSDRHLDVVLSIHRRARPDEPTVEVTVTTVVHVKNWLGRLYMLPVRPMHRIIAPAVLAAIGREPRPS